MKKLTILLSTILLYTALGYAQVAINTDGSNADSSTMLDVKSTDKGILIPRLTENERDAITNPAQGLQIFNLTTGCLNYFFGSNWCSLCGCDEPPEATIIGLQYEFSSIDSILVEAEEPIDGEGEWKIKSQTGSGYFSNPINSSTYFHGNLNEHYELEWETYNACGTNTTIKYISFVQPGLFVDAIFGDDNNSGTLEDPFKTITKGVEKAIDLNYSNVFVTQGLYEEQLNLKSGIYIWGGFDHFSNFRDIELHESRIEFQDIAVYANGEVNCGIYGFTIVGKSGGGNTYGVFVKDCQGVILEQCKIFSENGIDGSDGCDGINGLDGTDGADGENGCENGGDASCDTCTEPIPGLGGMAYFGGNNVSGGEGGQPGFADIYAGGNGYNGQGLYFGIGGGGGSYLQIGFNGENGGEGNNGNNGNGGVQFGNIVPTGYAVSSGVDGTDGQHGSGGGGGGGQGGIIVYNVSPTGQCNWYGGAGGGGGSGGQAGTGGGGGTGGYGSFGIWIYNSTNVFLENLTVKTGNGGNGGRGGLAGVGGIGGTGGTGGSDLHSCERYAGDGGDGSNGTNGGHGGGGGGGPSIGIVKDLASVVNIASISYNIGAGGQGGFSYGNSGQNGLSMNTNF